MSTPIINAQMDAINGSMATLKGDLTTLRPLIKTLKETALNAYATESLSNQAVASFTDGAKNIPVKSLSVAIDPIQNLNGQTSPYPAGGGKNKLPTPTSITADTGITVTNNNGVLSISGSISSGKSIYVSFDDVTLASSGQRIALMNSFTGATIYFLYGSTQKDYFTLSSSNRVLSENDLSALHGVTINKYRIAFQSSMSSATISPMLLANDADTTTFAPYSNICPISGHTECKVTRTGKNICNSALEVGNFDNDGYNSVNANRLRLKDFVPVVAGQTITVSFNSTAIDRFALSGYAGNEYSNNPRIQSTGWNNNEASITIDSGVKYIRLNFRPATEQAVSPSMISNLQIEYGSTATTYEPYAGQTYTIDLDGTRYGGTLDVTTGVLTVTHASVDMGDLTWDYRSDYAFFYAMNLVVSSLDLKSSMYKTLTSQKTSSQMASVDNYSITKQTGYPTLLVKNTDYTDSPTFKTAMSGVQLVYELATPTTVQLTPTEVTTLLGQNNIWADSGDIVEVTYRADTALYIEKRLA